MKEIPTVSEIRGISDHLGGFLLRRGENSSGKAVRGGALMWGRGGPGGLSRGLRRFRELNHLGTQLGQLLRIGKGVSQVPWRMYVEFFPLIAQDRFGIDPGDEQTLLSARQQHQVVSLREERDDTFGEL